MRFIHLSDVHLGAAPDRGYPWCEKRREEIWESFRRVIAAIEDDPVDILLIAGDLFHRQPLLSELREVAYLFGRIPNTRIYLAAGNHDYISPDSFYRGFTWPENVVFFPSETPQRVKDALLPVYIYGLSYEHAQISDPLYQDLFPWQDREAQTDQEQDDQEEEGTEEYHILLAHGGDDDHIPIDVRGLLRSGFDYIALGHIHKPQILFRDRAAYAGSLEPLDHTELGDHGFIRGWTNHGILHTRFVSFSERTYRRIELEMSEEDTQGSIETRLRECISNEGPGNIYRIILKGQRAPEQLIFTERLKRLGNIIEVEDQTRPAFDLPDLYHRFRGTILGDYIWSFASDQNGKLDFSALSEVEEKALYFGLQALLETSQLSGQR
ncbi:MAG: DNA repair exonuclease [Blautia sp.]|nr:DNA repair exonuclease [Blautia sp.]